MRDLFTCVYCGREYNPLSVDLSIDHIDPSGGDDTSNLATSCRSCNSQKGRRTPQDFMDQMNIGAKLKSQPAFDEVISEIAKLHGVKKTEILGGGRAGRVVEARDHVVWYLNDHGWGPSDIGRALNRDHSTIIHSLKKASRFSTVSHSISTQLSTAPNV